MDLWHLRTFLAVAETLNFTRASEELNLSQPAVSHQIKMIESQLGDQVFDREGKTIRLTPAGQLFAEYANTVVDTTEDLKRRIEEQKEKLSGTVRTAIASRSLDAPFATVQKDFNASVPDVKLTFRNYATATELIDGVEKGEIDLAMTEIRPESDSLRSVPYGLFGMVMVVSPEHHLAGKSDISLHKLQFEKWALLDESDTYGRVVREAFTKNKINPKSIFSTNDGWVITDMVSAGTHVSILFNIGVVRAIEEGKLARVHVPELESDVQVHMVWKASNEGPSLDSLVKFLLEYPVPGMNPKNLGTPKERRRL